MSKTVFEILSEFISAKMRMSHIYQPVMIRELLMRGGQASVDEIAEKLTLLPTSVRPTRTEVNVSSCHS